MNLATGNEKELICLEFQFSHQRHHSKASKNILIFIRSISVMFNFGEAQEYAFSSYVIGNVPAHLAGVISYSPGCNRGVDGGRDGWVKFHF